MALDGSWRTGAIRRMQSEPKYGTGAQDPRSLPSGTRLPCAARISIYRHRNEVKRPWGRPKKWRAVATRYEKLAASFMGVLCLAVTMDWIKL